MRATTSRMAWRNLWRNRRRTALALVAIGLSTALVLVFNGVLHAYSDWMVSTITGPMLGDVQIHAAGWRKDRAIDRTLPDATAALARLRSDPGVASASARVYGPVLVALGEEGFAAVVIGLEPQRESGSMGLLASARTTPNGRNISIGRKLASSMGVHVGDELALVGQAIDGTLANDLYRVTELVDTQVDLVNRQGIVMDLREAQRLLGMGDEVHEIVIHARDPATSAELARHLAASPALRGAEVRDWRALAPDLVAMIQLIDVSWIVVLGFVFVAAAAGVANTMLISTFERTRELGMVLALGARPKRIVAMVVLEALALGLVGAAVGVGLGGALVALTHRYGLDLAQLTGGGPTQLSFAGMSWSLTLYPTLDLVDVTRVVIAVVATSLVASAWPAIRAARLQPVQALRV
ncbi:MAG TPA: FtsX-like permease family protein [Kofleriaceae bacterium]|nr:FtsX-like permease family protein [Kofleriaceae bacterium]